MYSSAVSVSQMIGVALCWFASIQSLTLKRCFPISLLIWGDVWTLLGCKSILGARFCMSQIFARKFAHISSADEPHPLQICIFIPMYLTKAHTCNVNFPCRTEPNIQNVLSKRQSTDVLVCTFLRQQWKFSNALHYIFGEVLRSLRYLRLLQWYLQINLHLTRLTLNKEQMLLHSKQSTV